MATREVAATAEAHGAADPGEVATVESEEKAMRVMHGGDDSQHLELL